MIRDRKIIYYWVNDTANIGDIGGGNNLPILIQEGEASHWGVLSQHFDDVLRFEMTKSPFNLLGLQASLDNFPISGTTVGILIEDACVHFSANLIDENLLSALLKSTQRMIRRRFPANERAIA